MLVRAEDFVPGMAPGVVPTPDAFLRPDAGTLFQHRAQRLRAVAQGHAIGDFLSFLAMLADAQHGPASRALATWQDALGPILAHVLASASDLPAPVLATAQALAGEDDAGLNARMTRWLGGMPDESDLAGAPFLTAALQVQRTLAAAQAEPAAMGKGRCPLCGGAPVASTIATHNGLKGVRYLHCGLCACAWHMERLRCTQCNSDGKVVYQHIEPLGREVAAETCEHCGTYVKVLHMDAHPDWEPLADDLASIALDLRLGEDGWRRLWPNPFLHAA